MSDDNVELYKRHRPVLFKHVIGQDQAVALLKSFIKQRRVPHSILFSGPSGCGKTTFARILRKKLGCLDRDFFEMNSAEARGIDDIRRIQDRLHLNAMGKCRVYLIDECHRLTKDAQSALLKTLEDTPRHVYFFLCTTDRFQLLPTILTRCTEVRVNALSRHGLEAVIAAALDREHRTITEDVRDALIEQVEVEGSARQVLVLLEQILTMDDEEKQLEWLRDHQKRAQAIDLARILIKPRSTYAEAAAVVKSLSDDPEGARRMILGYCASVMLGGGKMASRAYVIVDALRDNLFDSGRAGLAAAIWEVYHGE